MPIEVRVHRGLLCVRSGISEALQGVVGGLVEFLPHVLDVQGAEILKGRQAVPRPTRGLRRLRRSGKYAENARRLQRYRLYLVEFSCGARHSRPSVVKRWPQVAHSRRRLMAPGNRADSLTLVTLLRCSPQAGQTGIGVAPLLEKGVQVLIVAASVSPPQVG